MSTSQRIARESSVNLFMGDVFANIEAERAILDRIIDRRKRATTLADALVSGGFDYTPGVGFHMPVTGQSKPYDPAAWTPAHRPEVRQHGALGHPEDDGFYEDDHAYVAVFTDCRTGEQTYVCEDGTVPVGDVLNVAPVPSSRRRAVR